MTIDKSDSSFGIGTVSRLTGIPVDTLRIWERRYGAIVPRRSVQNRRFYSRADVARLLLIKQLVELGEPVGSVVQLGEMELRTRLEAHDDFQRQLTAAGGGIEAAAPLTALVYGEVLSHQMRQWTDQLTGMNIVGCFDVFGDFERTLTASRPDVAILEFPALRQEALQRISALLAHGQCRQWIVVYAFAASAVLERLRRLGVRLLRAPVTPAVLLETVLNAVGGPTPWVPAEPKGTVVPRRYDGRALAEIAALDPGLRCECPRHLVDLVARLQAFEQYSLDCEINSSRDAAVHARLYEMTAQARAMLEAALGYVLDSEGIQLTGDAVNSKTRVRAE